MQAIEKSVIDSMLKRHLGSHYQIGELFEIKTRSKLDFFTTETHIVPLMDVTIEFEYEVYKTLCEHGKSVSRGQGVRPYKTTFKYAYLMEKVIWQEHYNFCNDPISNIHTMNKKILDFSNSCKKIIVRHNG